MGPGEKPHPLGVPSRAPGDAMRDLAYMTSIAMIGWGTGMFYVGIVLAWPSRLMTPVMWWSVRLLIAGLMGVAAMTVSWMVWP